MVGSTHTESAPKESSVFDSPFTVLDGLLYTTALLALILIATAFILRSSRQFSRDRDALIGILVLTALLADVTIWAAVLVR